MATNVRKIDNLDVPFKEFMPGQIIQSGQFNDDMKDIEDKVNEIIGEQNTLVDEVNAHTDNFENPHQVTAHQTGTYTSEEIDEFIEDIKSGNLHDNAIGNRVLDDDCVSTRNILDGSITSSKLDGSVGSQIDISTNVSIKDRYTKEETDAIIQEKVGSGTYDKATIDDKLEQIQAGQILDKSISIHQLKDDVGRRLDISNNPDILNKYTRDEVDLLIQNNALPRDWGSILEEDNDTPVIIPTKEITLPVANHMKANTFTVSESSILDIDIQENVDARGEFDTVGERLNSVDSQIKEKTNPWLNNVNFKSNEFNIFVKNIDELKKAIENSKSLLTHKNVTIYLASNVYPTETIEFNNFNYDKTLSILPASNKQDATLIGKGYKLEDYVMENDLRVYDLNGLYLPYYSYSLYDTYNDARVKYAFDYNRENNECFKSISYTYIQGTSNFLTIPKTSNIKRTSEQLLVIEKWNTYLYDIKSIIENGENLEIHLVQDRKVSGYNEQEKDFILLSSKDLVIDENTFFIDYTNNKLYYKPLNSMSELYLPITEKIIDIKNSKNINISKLELKYTADNKNITNELLRGFQAGLAGGNNSTKIDSEFPNGCITIKDSNYITINNCKVKFNAYNAITLLNNSCYCDIINNKVSDSNVGGIYLKDLCHNNKILNNEVFNLGQFVKTGVGVFIQGTEVVEGDSFPSRNNEIIGNEIHDLIYSGISIGWNWGHFSKDDNSKFSCPETKIQNNKIYNIGTSYGEWSPNYNRLSDLGGIYTLGNNKNTVISDNVIGFITGNSLANGIYLDGSTSGLIEIYNNEVFAVRSHALFHLCNTGGKNYHVYNNYFDGTISTTYSNGDSYNPDGETNAKFINNTVVDFIHDNDDFSRMQVITNKDDVLTNINNNNYITKYVSPYLKYLLLNNNSLNDKDSKIIVINENIDTLTNKDYTTFLTKGNLGKFLNSICLKNENIRTSEIYGLDNEIGIGHNTKTNTIYRIVNNKKLYKAGINFDKVYPYSEIKKCTINDNGDVTSYIGSDNYIEDGSNGQVMVEIPKFYYKKNVINGIYEYYICPIKKDGYKVHPAFVTESGEKDYIYIGAYESSIYDVSEGVYLKENEQIGDFTVSAGDKLSSISDVLSATGISQEFTLENSRVLAKNRGEKFGIMNYKYMSALQLLMSIEFGGFDMQTLFDNGISFNGGHIRNGLTSKFGDEISKAKSETKEYSISYRGIENIYGNKFCYVDGIDLNYNVLRVCTKDDYSEDANYVDNISVINPSNGYINSLQHIEGYDFMFYPMTVSSSITKTFGDFYVRTKADRRALIWGGRSNDGNNNGIFYYALVRGKREKNSSDTTRLCL